MKKKITLITILILIMTVLGGCAVKMYTMETYNGEYWLMLSGEEKRVVKDKTDGTGYYIQDNNGNTKLNVFYVNPEDVEIPADYQTVWNRKRKYIYYTEDGYYVYCSYLADIGADIGIVILTKDKEEMKYFGIKGTSLQGASKDPTKYFTNVSSIATED